MNAIADHVSEVSIHDHPTRQPSEQLGPSKILIVDDEVAMGQVVAAFLSMYGFSPLRACSEGECLKIWSREGDRISHVIMDVNLGTSDGRDLARHLMEEKPTLKVLFISGYTPESLEDTSLIEGINFLHKPFSPDQLNRWLRWTAPAKNN